MTKGKFSIKTIIVIVILLLVGVLGVLGVNTAKTYLSGASADLAPKNVLGKPSEDGKSAVITWVTDKPAMGVVEYGTTPASLLLRAPETDQNTSHTVNLSPLKGNTNYYFRVRVGEEVFDNNGIPYSFKTKVATAVPTVEPIVSAPTMPVVSGTPTGCDRTTDYNKDKIVNSLDYMYCLKNKPTGGSSVITTPSPAATSDCLTTVDYNKDGKINSLDRLKCLQDKKL